MDKLNQDICNDLKVLINRIDQIEGYLLGRKKALTLNEFCKYTGYSKSYAYKLTSSRSVPFSNPSGKALFFDRAQIDEWLLRGPQNTKEELIASVKKTSFPEFLK